MSDILTFAQITPNSADVVGGKGLSLGLTSSAGLPVPPGFCVTASAYRRHADQRIDSTLLAALLAAYRELGGGVVAVRSSATAEDGAVTSFAGQQETILGVEGDDDLRNAVERCWRSLHTERARAYRDKQGVGESGLAMAVVVQRLVDAEVAGVMFTRDPLDATGTLLRIEASWGLGEAVVSGKVTPDRFQVERDSGRVRERQTGKKQVAISRHGEQPVASDRQDALCLTDKQLAQLADLGRRVEAFYGDARDIEWAIADGRVWLLQARPITTISAADRERVRRETIERLAKLVEPGGTVWSRTNLVEVLSEPTPMTWAIVSSRLLSGGGGTGAMYRDVGFHPDPALAAISGYDLIGGRPYLNLSREPRLESKRPLSGYPLAKYKAAPNLALDPKRDEPRGLRKLLGLFGTIRVVAKVLSASKRFVAQFRQTIIPEFVAKVEQAAREDLSTFDPPRLVQRFEDWVNWTLVDFARHSLKPTLLAQYSWHVLEQQCTWSQGKERASAIVTELSQGAKADPEADLPGAIRALAAGGDSSPVPAAGRGAGGEGFSAGHIDPSPQPPPRRGEGEKRMSRGEFLKRFGHRGPNEMELSSPRWSEDFSLHSMASSVNTSAKLAGETAAAEVLGRVAADAKWNRPLTQLMSEHLERMRTYLGLRETGKHYLMLGYAEIRRTLLELDRRFKLVGGIFFLTTDELPQLVAGKDMKPLIAERRRSRAIELSLEVPPVLFGDDLDAIGRPLPPPDGAEELKGVPLSAGVVEGPALVLIEPSAATVEPGYILVCPSTDPAWVPLFVNARGLVMESGGTLSHGAIVAREFGLPAVAGLPGVQRRIKTGQRLRVDGGRGTVSVLS